MEYKYLITDIQEKTKVSITSLTAFKKKHQNFFNDNSIRQHRKIYYNQAAMDFFISYYLPEQPTEESKIPSSNIDTERAEKQAENPLLETSHKEEEQQATIDALQMDKKALQEEIDALKRQLEEKENERKELLRQNGALILTIQQQQQEKMLLLPQPKKSFTDKVKSLFKGKS